MINKEKALENAVRLCRNKKILIPTFAELGDPEKIDPLIKDQLKKIELNAINPLNLFRICWYNDPSTGGYQELPTFVEIPPKISGVKPRIIGMVGKYFPTGAHKVGAAFGCLVPKLVSGEFDPTVHKAVWPSTGNYCRGGTFDSALLGCQAVAILPEQMSKERFDWLKKMGAEILATPGCESNVKEIFDACWKIRDTQPNAVIFNQFEEYGNYMWHYGLTGKAAEKIFCSLAGPKSRFAGWIGSTGSSGTLAAGDYLKKTFPESIIVASEALQCPTLLYNGYGAHRIEGIGDKHVPWIHNVRNTDFVVGIDDESSLRVFRLFNEKAGQEFLSGKGVPDNIIEKLPFFGISGVCNLLTAIKTSLYYELTEDDVLFTCLTDSSDMYLSRLEEMNQGTVVYNKKAAELDFERHLAASHIGHVRELSYWERKSIHNLKYFTWVEQQGRSVEELNELWNPRFWQDLTREIPNWDQDIKNFNKKTGVLELLKKGS